MIRLKPDIAVIGTVNDILLEQAENRGQFKAPEITPRSVLEYTCLVYVRAGFPVAPSFTEDDVERLLINRKDVFEQIWKLGDKFSYRLQTEKFLSPEELTQARTAYLSHSSAVSVTAQLLNVLMPDHSYGGYPRLVLDKMNLYEAIRWQKN